MSRRPLGLLGRTILCLAVARTDANRAAPSLDAEREAGAVHDGGEAEHAILLQPRFPKSRPTTLAFIQMGQLSYVTPWHVKKIRRHHAEVRGSIGGWPRAQADLPRNEDAAGYGHIASAIQVLEAKARNSNSTARRAPRQEHAGVRTETNAWDYRAQTAIALTNLRDSQYVGRIGVGSNMDPIHVVFDTGSTNIWIASTYCKTHPCIDHKRFDAEKSMTFKPTNNLIEVLFGTGKLGGFIGVDDFAIGPFTVKKQHFALIEQEDGEIFSALNFEGICGLAFKAMSSNGVPPIFDNIVQQRLMKRNEFSFFFTKLPDSSSAIFFGGVDKRFYTPPIRMLPVLEEYYWLVGVKGFWIGDKLIEGPRAAVFDTGTTYFTTPKTLTPTILDYLPRVSCQDAVAGVQWLHLPKKPCRGQGLDSWADGSAADPLTGLADTAPCKETCASRPECAGFEVVVDATNSLSCVWMSSVEAALDDLAEDSGWDSPSVRGTSCHWQRPLPDLRYDFQGHDDETVTVTIKPREYYVGGTDGDCDPAWISIDVPQPHGPAFIMGEVFMRSFYTVFDRGNARTGPQVGFARTRHEERAENVIRDLHGGYMSSIDGGSRGNIANGDSLDSKQGSQSPNSFADFIHGLAKSGPWSRSWSLLEGNHNHSSAATSAPVTLVDEEDSLSSPRQPDLAVRATDPEIAADIAVELGPRSLRQLRRRLARWRSRRGSALSKGQRQASLDE